MELGSTRPALNVSPSPLFVSEGWQLFSLSVSPPGAGANFSLQLDDRFIFRVKVVRFRLTTSAAVANRLVTLRVTPPSFNPFGFPAGGVQAASLALFYTCAWFGGPIANDAFGGYVQLPYFEVEEGTVISSAVSLIDVADAIDQIFVTGLRRRL